MAYTLTLTKADRDAIAFVGHRYAWSNALGHLYARSAWEGDSDSDEPITYTMPEHVAWELAEAFEQDTEGGHSYFPMLDGRSELAEKLYALISAIV